MTDHPLIPLEALAAAESAYVMGDAMSVMGGVEDALRAAAPILWREWTRGRAVVDLPAMREDHRWVLRNADILADGNVVDSPAVWLDDKDYSAEEAREVAAALLAAADLAEEITGRTVHTTGGES